jgi:ArsR family transcriptional regulator
MVVSLADVPTAGRLAAVFRALGDPARVRLVSLIGTAVGGEACVRDLIAPVGLSQSTVSHHMKVLADAGLVQREQRGRWAYYRLDHAAFAAVSDVLARHGRDT